MKKALLSITLFASISSFAQIGIGTDQPITTLHVKELRDPTNQINNINSKDGILIPRLSKKELAEKSNNIYNNTTYGTLVFVNNVAETPSGSIVIQTVNITTEGFYFFNTDNTWMPIAGLGLDNSNDAWVNNPAQSRVELGTTSKGQTRSANTQVVATDAGFVGINTNAPTKRLEINASTPGNTTDVLRITNLAIPAATTITSTLQIDNQGNVGKKSEENVEGQIIRLPISSQSVTAGQTLPIRFESGNNAPNGTLNRIELITGSSVSNFTYTAPYNFTTSRIKLPKGIYKYDAKIIGSFDVASINNSITLTTLINGIEYTAQDYGSNTQNLDSNSQHFTGFVQLIILYLKQMAISILS